MIRFFHAMRPRVAGTLAVLLLSALAATVRAQPAPAPPTTQPAAHPRIEVRLHLGKPTVHVDGKPVAIPMYSPMGFSRPHFLKQVPFFTPHHMGAYFIWRPFADGDGWAASQFWNGDQISSTPVNPKLAGGSPSFEEQIDFIRERDPDAYFFVREITTDAPPSWRKLHADQLFVTQEGKPLDNASLASDLYWDALARAAGATIEAIEKQPWSDRVLGYWCGIFGEGTYGPVADGWLFDHSAPMTAKWRAFLREKYGSVEKLREAHKDPKLEFDTIEVPRDPLLEGQAKLAGLSYWQDASENRPRRDYLELTAKLVHQGYEKYMAACAKGSGGKKICLHDALKLTQLGWNLHGFFDPGKGWWPAYPEFMTGGGYIGVTRIFDFPGCDGLVTPHDYQARGPGGVFEPEGSVDSIVLRGKLFLCEMDTRTFANPPLDYGSALDVREYAAVSWRNFATGFTRGFHPYWMDLCGKPEGWFGEAEIQKVVARQVEFNEAIMWEQKMGLARCGVPWRVYLFEDLERDNFPAHRVFYFPNLFRADDKRLALLKSKVFRDGNVVLWGPGSGISDGQKIATASATKLTGFEFQPLMPGNIQRRTLLTRFDHPLTQGLPADTVLGGPLAFGPGLYPKDGLSLGEAWTVQGKRYSGLAVKTFGKGPRGAYKGKEPLGEGDWASVFSTTVPMPAEVWRRLARFAGAHVWSEGNDVLLADESVVALHSVQSGPKRIELPGPCRVWDVVTGKQVAGRTEKIEFDLVAPETRVFRMERR
ncbi:MAG: hypothetical protein NTW19_20145 [Planctomycetota bacterium]|nr:hypothetical protein [Planctomycetota bacterium]